MAVHVCRSIVIVSGFLLALLGILLGFWIFPTLIETKINDSAPLTNGSDTYSRWQKLPIPVKNKIYFFTVVNIDEVQQGLKPNVSQVGPYVYDEYYEKINISESDEKLTYYQNHTFKFNAEASYPLTEDDNITIVNLPMLATMIMVEKINPGQLGTLNKMINTLFENPKDLFLRTTPKNFLFDGIYIRCDLISDNTLHQAVCIKINKNKPPQIQEIKDDSSSSPFARKSRTGRLKFSLLGYKNYTNDGLFVINSGIKDVNSVGEIFSWKNSSTVDAWQPNSTCNNVYGTDGTIFSPHKTAESKVNVFQTDLCRTINLYHNSTVTYKGIEGIRFTAGKEMLASGKTYSANKCFCMQSTTGITDEDGCLFDGALELYTCQHSPIVMTLPHFYLAHKNYSNTVDGLAPDPSLHGVFIDLEPNTGNVLRGSKRAQFNLFFRQIQKIDLTENLTTALMPIVWLDQGVELGEEQIQLLNDKLFTPKLLLEIFYWSLFGVGLLIGFLGIIWCMVFSHKPKGLTI